MGSQLREHLSLTRRSLLKRCDRILDVLRAAKSLDEVPNPLALPAVRIDTQLPGGQARVGTKGERVNTTVDSRAKGNGMNVAAEGAEGILSGEVVGGDPGAGNQFLLADSATFEVLLQQKKKLLVV